MKELEQAGHKMKSDWCLDCANIGGCPSCCDGLPPKMLKRIQMGLKKIPVGYRKDKNVNISV